MKGEAVLVDNWVGLLIWRSARFMPIVHVVLTRDTSSHTLPSISRQMCTTHFCWGNLTIGWHPDDDGGGENVKNETGAV